MKTLILPNTNTYLVDGSIVELARFPGMKWVVHYGWYTYKGNQTSGWYFSSIPSQTTIPVKDEDLRTLTVISGDCECHCPPGGVEWDDDTCPGPGPKPPRPEDACTPKRRWELDRAAISVNTIAERDLLNKDRLLPDGKLVRVSECPDGTTKYFAWNQATQTWDEESFGSGASVDAYSRKEADDKFATKESVASEVSAQIEATDIDGKVKAAVEDADIPSVVQSTIPEDETVKAAIQNAAEEVVPPIVEGHVNELTQKVDELSDKVDAMEAPASWEPLPEVTT